MRRTHSLIALAVLCCVAGRVSHARAEAALVLVVGKAPAKDRATVASAVRSAARSGGWALTETPLTDSETATILNCLKAPQRWACISPLTSGKGIQRLIVVSVEPERTPDDNGALALTEQILLPGSDVTTADRRSCPKCTEEALTRITFDLTKGLLEEASAGTGRTRLRIMSTPPGAWITLDNTSAGLTDHTYSTFPGRHVVIVQRDGYPIETRNVDVAENQETIVAVTLRTQDSVVRTPRVTSAEHHPYLIPAIIGGAGAVALAVGIGLQLHEGPPAVGQDQPTRLVNGPAIGLIAGGGVAIGVGLGVYLWTRAAHRAAPTSTPAVAATTGGGIVGWTSRF